MVGIMWDIGKTIATIKDPYEAQIVFLKSLVSQKDNEICELRELLYEQAGHAPRDVAVPKPARIRNWREQKARLEQKFRPPELTERETRWRKIASEEASTLQEESGTQENA